MILPARHDLQTSWRAQRLRIGVSKTKPLGRKLIEPRSLIIRTTITAQSLETNVIRHDQDNLLGKYGVLRQ